MIYLRVPWPALPPQGFFDSDDKLGSCVIDLIPLPTAITTRPANGRANGSTNGSTNGSANGRANGLNSEPNGIANGPDRPNAPNDGAWYPLNPPGSIAVEDGPYHGICAWGEVKVQIVWGVAFLKEVDEAAAAEAAAEEKAAAAAAAAAAASAASEVASAEYAELTNEEAQKVSEKRGNG